MIRYMVKWIKREKLLIALVIVGLIILFIGLPKIHYLATHQKSPFDDLPFDVYKISISKYSEPDHYCHRYEKDGENWILYDENNEMFKTLIIPEEYIVTVKRYRKGMKYGY